MIEAFSSDGDIVLDSFAGSGTTAHAVMQINKNKSTSRKYILVEIDKNNAEKVIFPRLKSVINGVSKIGLEPHYGGFKYYTLAPSLLNKDKYGNWVISKEYNPDMLAAAMAKQEGFRYQPDEAVYWKQALAAAKRIFSLLPQRS